MTDDIFIGNHSGLITSLARTAGSTSAATAGDVLRYLGVTGAFDVNFTLNPPPFNPRGLTFGGPVGDLYVIFDCKSNP